VAAARAAGLVPQMLKVSGPKPDLDGAFKAMVSEGAEALVVLEVPSVFNIARNVAERAAAQRMPMVVWGGQGDAGGLISYGTSFVTTYPRVAVVVDRILKGAPPASTAIEVVSKRELVINTRTALALGVTVPVDMLRRADRVVE
jgi:putative tryptophan/tyrosine transport system substrate-binding protein